MGKKMSKNADMTPASRTTLVNLFSLIAVLTLLGAEAHAFGTDVNLWTSIGPDGGMVTSLAIDPQNPKTIYAGTAGYNGDSGGGIFRSTDGGAHQRTISQRGKWFVLVEHEFPRHIARRSSLGRL